MTDATGAALLELLRAVAEVLNASSAAAEARAIERLREAAREPLDSGLTLLEGAIEAAEHATDAGAGPARDLAVLERYRDSKPGADPAPASEEAADEITEHDTERGNLLVRAGYLRGLARCVADDNDRLYLLRACRSLRAFAETKDGGK